MYEASVAVDPRPNVAAKRRKKSLHIWNEEISVVVERNRQAHKDWREAGSPFDHTTSVIQRQARRLMRRVFRHQIYADNQGTFQEIWKLKNRIQNVLLVSESNTATEVLYLDGKTWSSVREVADAFSEHFEILATPADNPDFDAVHKAG